MLRLTDVIFVCFFVALLCLLYDQICLEQVESYVVISLSFMIANLFQYYFALFHHICNTSHVCAFNQDSVICMAFCCYFFGIILTYHAKTYSAMQCTDIFNQSAFRLLINTIKMVSSFVYRTVWWKPVELPCNVQGSALYCVPPYVKLLYKSAHWFLSIFKLISRDSSS